MDCETVTGHLADYLAGTLSDRLRDVIGQHLAGCARCRDEASALERTWDLLGDVAAEPADSTAMRTRFTAMLEGYEGGYEHRRARSLEPSPIARLSAWLLTPRAWSPALQAAAALLVLAAGVAVGRQSSSTPAPSATSAAPSAEVSAMRQELRDLHEMVTLSLMQQQSASERLKGVSWSGRIEQPGNQVVSALLDTLTHDPNVNVRLASIDALKRFTMDGSVRQATVEALAHQTSPIVQVALIDFFVEMNERSSVAALRLLSQDTMQDATVRSRATWGLERLGAKS